MYISSLFLLGKRGHQTVIRKYILRNTYLLISVSMTLDFSACSDAIHCFVGGVSVEGEASERPFGRRLPKGFRANELQKSAREEYEERRKRRGH